MSNRREFLESCLGLGVLAAFDKERLVQPLLDPGCFIRPLPNRGPFFVKTIQVRKAKARIRIEGADFLITDPRYYEQPARPNYAFNVEFAAGLVVPGEGVEVRGDPGAMVTLCGWHWDKKEQLMLPYVYWVMVEGGRRGILRRGRRAKWSEVV